MSDKKKIKLEKETLMELQEDQMKALVGAENMSTDSGAGCGNTIDDEILQAAFKANDNSCCRRSCNGK